jgi:hypothetical protein
MPCFVVERYWPGVVAADVTALSRTLRHWLSDHPGAEVGYLGSVLLVDDDVVQCRFEGPDPAAIRGLNEAAGTKFDRILEAQAYSS